MKKHSLPGGRTHQIQMGPCRWRVRGWVRLGVWTGVLIIAGAANARADKLDDFIEIQIQKRHIPGLSLAVIEDGRIIMAKGYGVCDKESSRPVTTSTLFLAGSVSKSVAALGALHLVDKGKLSLDTDVNTQLKTWKVPENEFTKTKKVTLRSILSHSAGLTVHGFPGYAVDEPHPTLVEILDGVKPANTPPIRVDLVPGSKLRYSGGGYTVMQQLIIDVTGEPFPNFMQECVLGPLAMTNSTYDQPLPESRSTAAATGYYGGDKAVPGRWHVYPEMAAAGLWTTASDLASFAIGIQRSLKAKSNPVISQSTTRQMLTDQGEMDGLGVFLLGKGETLRFVHNGRDEGFDAIMTGYALRGQGAVILINVNDDSGAIARILEAIAHEYQWPDFH